MTNKYFTAYLKESGAWIKIERKFNKLLILFDLRLLKIDSAVGWLKSRKLEKVDNLEVIEFKICLNSSKKWGSSEWAAIMRVLSSMSRTVR